MQRRLKEWRREREGSVDAWRWYSQILQHPHKISYLILTTAPMHTYITSQNAARLVLPSLSQSSTFMPASPNGSYGRSNRWKAFRCGSTT